MIEELDVQRIVIEINPKTLEYSLDVQYCNLNHLYSVLKNVISQIENGDFEALEVGNERTNTTNEPGAN